MKIILKQDIIYYITNTDEYKLPAGGYTAIRLSYLNVEEKDIMTDRGTYQHTIFELVKKGEMFIVYHKRRYFAVRRETCEVPKIYNGWWNY